MAFGKKDPSGDKFEKAPLEQKVGIEDWRSMFRWPSKKKKFWRDEALNLRARYPKLIATHLF